MRDANGGITAISGIIIIITVFLLAAKLADFMVVSCKLKKPEKE